ncbi:MAG: hypothetical protein BWY36_00919 [Candidatus Diapherotrites archaeon ADurb.Bin253]|nr:MAG: hypothetical protein BWY36_00919 [Candidatus Diapherotrites archaeon ADurb.Bin253]
MSMWLLYFLVKLDAIGSMFGWFTFISVIVLVAYIIYKLFTIQSIADRNYMRGDEKIEDFKAQKKADGDKAFAELKKGIMKYSMISLMFILLTVLIPSTKEVAFIYVVGKLSQTTEVQNMAKNSLHVAENATKIPDKALEILNLKMNEYLEEVKGEAVKETKKAVKEVKGEAVEETKKAVKEVKETAKKAVN